LSQSVPAPPAFGQPAAYGQAHPDILAFLAGRRSSSPRDLAEPAPSPAELKDLLRLAARVPDHGKLFPWRFVILQGAAKAALAERFETLAKERPDAEKAVSVLFKLRVPPLAVAVVSSVKPSHIPDWEQRLSAGAVCQTLVLAATAMGYGANWITDWYSYEPRATALLGLLPGESVAGFILLGTPTTAPLERVRPDVDAITYVWEP
jgi:nitroreductase